MRRALAVVAAGAAGCFADIETAFPPGLEPLEANRAPALEAGACPDEVRLAEGERPEHIWVHARGCVPANLETTWRAMRDPEASVDRRAAAEWRVTLDTEPEYPFSYTLHITVRRFITVQYDMAWRHGPVEGTVDAPEKVAARFQKVFGTETISLLEGSAFAYPRGAGWTELELVYRLDAALRDPADIRGFVEDYHASVVALARGAPLPDWDD
jgi:hypothetical protein